jgi:hypothetical protein
VFSLHVSIACSYDVLAELFLLSSRCCAKESRFDLHMYEGSYSKCYARHIDLLPPRIDNSLGCGRNPCMIAKCAGQSSALIVDMYRISLNAS